MAPRALHTLKLYNLRWLLKAGIACRECDAVSLSYSRRDELRRKIFFRNLTPLLPTSPLSSVTTTSSRESTAVPRLARQIHPASDGSSLLYRTKVSCSRLVVFRMALRRTATREPSWMPLYIAQTRAWFLHMWPSW